MSWVLKVQVLGSSLWLRLTGWGRLFPYRSHLQMGCDTKRLLLPSTSGSIKNQTTTLPAAPNGIMKQSLAPLLPTPNSRPLPPIKKMSAAEMQLRREKGLCYTWDDKFTWNHKCPNRHYLLLQLEEEDDTGGGTDSPGTSHEASQSHHLSFNALKGTDAVGTIRFKGTIKGVEVQISLDGGSSNVVVHGIATSNYCFIYFIAAQVVC